MSFETHIADHLKTVRKGLQELRRQREYMLHDCNCEWCDHSGELSDDYTQEELDNIDKEIAEAKRTIESLKAHANLHRVKLPEMVA